MGSVLKMNKRKTSPGMGRSLSSVGSRVKPQRVVGLPGYTAVCGHTGSQASLKEVCHVTTKVSHHRPCLGKAKTKQKSCPWLKPAVSPSPAHHARLLRRRAQVALNGGVRRPQCAWKPTLASGKCVLAATACLFSFCLLG